MALEAETDQSIIKNYKCRFSDKVFSYLKQCKRINEKAVSERFGRNSLRSQGWATPTTHIIWLSTKDGDLCTSNMHIMPYNAT